MTSGRLLLVVNSDGYERFGKTLVRYQAVGRQTGSVLAFGCTSPRFLHVGVRAAMFIVAMPIVALAFHEELARERLQRYYDGVQSAGGEAG